MTDNIKTATCPDENLLNNYMTGRLDKDELLKIEKHLGSCPYCIYRIAEAKEILNDFESHKKMEDPLMSIRKINPWLTLSIGMFILSFLFPHYFIQFLIGTILFWMKWVVDNKNTKLLITIYDTWKSENKKDTDKIFERVNSRLRR